jgi:hypothetical protein
LQGPAAAYQFGSITTNNPYTYGLAEGGFLYPNGTSGWDRYEFGQTRYSCTQTMDCASAQALVSQTGANPLLKVSLATTENTYNYALANAQSGGSGTMFYIPITADLGDDVDNWAIPIAIKLTFNGQYNLTGGADTAYGYSLDTRNLGGSLYTYSGSKSSGTGSVTDSYEIIVPYGNLFENIIGLSLTGSLYHTTTDLDTAWYSVDINVRMVPLPSTLLLAASGLAGLIGLRRFWRI